ncbi:MAG TPA: two-component regulator propeller domain-containing protein, partial [Flavisolibacter sp.]|nr:two-component regulator propeller domain-containing protein [Flavisolibacter sp.]
MRFSLLSSYWIFLLAALFSQGLALGQSYSFRHLDTESGLLSDLRIQVAEDKIGRLWIASDEGINVFDGAELAAYSYPDNSGLLANNISAIHCDAAGTIWVAHEKGIQY